MASIVLPEGIQLLSGLEADRASVIPDVAEPLITTDEHHAYIGDNATPGGLPLLPYPLFNREVQYPVLADSPAGNPPADNIYLYQKTDGHYYKDPAGVEHPFLTLDNAPIGGLTGMKVLEGTVGSSTNAIRVSSGVCVDTTANAAMQLSATTTKTLDAAWAAGSGNGGMLTGAALAANSTATVWAIKDTTNDVVDVGIHTSASRPTVLAALPAGYDALQYLGAVMSSAVGTHDPFLSLGSWFFMRSPKLVHTTTTVPDEKWTTVTLGVPPNVVGNFTLAAFGSATANALVSMYLTWPGADIAADPDFKSSLYQVARTPSTGSYPLATRTLGFVDIASRVTWGVGYTSAFTPTQYDIYCHGWYDPQRGNL